MPNKKADVTERRAEETNADRPSDPIEKSGESRDALRHQQDEAHHKGNKEPSTRRP
jgi:hypothetical protein